MRRAARRRTSLLCAVARALAVAALASSVSLSPSGADAARAPTTTRPSGRALEERSRRCERSASSCSRARAPIVRSGRRAAFASPSSASERA